MKNPFTKKPGQADAKDAEAAKAIQKEQERLQAQYGIFRTIYEIQCIFLGVEEVAIMEYGDGGIAARVTRRSFSEKEKAKRHEFMRNRLKDFYAMTKDAAGKSALHEALAFIQDELKDIDEAIAEVDTPDQEENVAGILGVDGVPLDSAKPTEPKGESGEGTPAPAQEPLQEESNQA